MSRQGGIRELVPAKWKKAPKQRHYILKSSCRENEKWLAKNIQNKIPFFFFLRTLHISRLLAFASMLRTCLCQQETSPVIYEYRFHFLSLYTTRVKFSLPECSDGTLHEAVVTLGGLQGASQWLGAAF